MDDMTYSRPKYERRLPHNLLLRLGTAEMLSLSSMSVTSVQNVQSSGNAPLHSSEKILFQTLQLQGAKIMEDKSESKEHPEEHDEETTVGDSIMLSSSYS
jgi:hypothetical protein